MTTTRPPIRHRQPTRPRRSAQTPVIPILAVITAAQFTAGQAITLTLLGAATHTHTVALSQAELTQISGGTRVQKTSSTDNTHTHTVTFN